MYDYIAAEQRDKTGAMDWMKGKLTDHSFSFGEHNDPYVGLYRKEGCLLWLMNPSLMDNRPLLSITQLI